MAQRRKTKKFLATILSSNIGNLTIKNFESILLLNEYCILWLKSERLRPPANKMRIESPVTSCVCSPEYIILASIPSYIVLLEVLQSKNMQYHKLFCPVIILYHWLRLHKFPSPALFFVNRVFLWPHLSYRQLFFLSHGGPLFLCMLVCQ